MIGSIAAHANPKFGFFATHPWDARAGTLARMKKSLQKILAENVEALMKHRPEVGTEKLLRAKAKIGGGTLDGIRQMDKAPTLRTLEKLAKAFDIEPYQLLIPDFDPKNPVIARLMPNEQKFYRHLEEDIRRLQQTMADYGAEINE